jgi:hypothetical protein
VGRTLYGQGIDATRPAAWAGLYGANRRIMPRAQAPPWHRKGMKGRGGVPPGVDMAIGEALRRIQRRPQRLRGEGGRRCTNGGGLMA